jgi:hypothetical protein
MDEASSFGATKRDGLSLVDILDKEEEALLVQVDHTAAMRTDRIDSEDDELDSSNTINGRVNTSTDTDVPEGYCVECHDQEVSFLRYS